MSRLTRVLAVSLIALAVLVGPAAGSASAGVIDYDAIANCRYKVTATFSGTWMRAVLQKIAVQPPTIAKKTGTKSVGWRFIVERSMDRDSTPWVLTYRSPLQHASSSAGLSPMRVSVNVPPEDQTPDGRERVWYRVTIKLFWYGSGGSIQSKASHKMDDEHIIIRDEDEWIDSICQGAQQQYT